ncbi:MAG: SURF1 family cytochrome oxidase biogenesis protein [Gordonia sp. (in: high G+C Gram-positive bacteria)]|uniref:SURF1 family cytochrome oxidase biogenesis protein n=1 Tax=Gordonia sp. (in: high G+C Gram-positive bacteria) TaxID=84139 RepID=UPI0039E5DAB9
MQLLRTFLKPGWLLTTVLVIMFAAACFLVLAPWQLGKNADTEHRNTLIRTAVDTPAVPLDELVPPGAALKADDEWREITVTGRYLADKQVLLRLRSVEERPAVQALTPFQVAGSDRVILIDRGYFRPEVDGSVVSPGSPAEQVTVSARLRRSEGTSPGKEPRVEEGRLTAYTIDTAQLSTASGVALAPFYVQLVDGQPGVLSPMALPRLETGPYLSYGLQWLAFGIMAPLGVAYFVWSEVKHRRALKAAADGEPAPTGPAESGRNSERRQILDRLAAASTASPPDDEPGEPPRTADDERSLDDEVAARLAQRYGR